MMPKEAFNRRGRLAIVVRILLALLGGYAAGWGVIALCAAGSFPLGAELHDGEALGSILAFLLYPAAFLWAFGARSPWRVGAVLVGGGMLMTAAGSLIQMRVT